jgi:hypothetical protein
LWWPVMWILGVCMSFGVLQNHAVKVVRHELTNCMNKLRD